MNAKKVYVFFTSLLPTLLTGCQGTYMNGLVVVDSIKPQEQRQLVDQRPAKWGECNTWRQVRITSDNDVDTAYYKIIRSKIINYPHVPQTKNDQVNQHINQEWKHPSEQPGLVYYLPPRWMEVQVDKYNQAGAVAFIISKNNHRNLQGSFIDIEYCEGDKYEIGFHVRHHMKAKFETNLKAKFNLALK